MMKFYFAFIIATLLCISSWAQIRLQPALSTTYLQHSRLVGVNITNDLLLPLRKGTVVIGLGVNYAEGNRNFDPDRAELYNLEFKGYFAPYQAFPVESYQFNEAIELKPTTSAAFQIYIKTGYQYQSKWGNIEGGTYVTFVRRDYIATILYDSSITFRDVSFNAALAVPYRLRYLDAGIYLSYSKNIFKDLKVPVLAKASAFLATQHNSWYNLGLAIEI